VASQREVASADPYGCPKTLAGTELILFVLFPS
jgi:hypothetical protein